MINKFTYLIETAVDTKSIQDEIRTMIQDSLKTTDNKTVEDFIQAYKENPKDNQIQGLIIDADIYNFYIKYRDEIDEILNKEDFYSESPEQLNVYSLYNYIIVGTKKAIELSINNFGNDLDNKPDTEEGLGTPTF